MNLQEDINRLLHVCMWRSASNGNLEKYEQWKNGNRSWINNQLRLIGKKYRLVWNVKENRFIEVNVI